LYRWQGLKPRLRRRRSFDEAGEDPAKAEALVGRGFSERESGILKAMGRYEFIDHMADVGILVEGESPGDLFTTAAQALMAWIGPPPAGQLMQDTVTIEADAKEELLVRWLQEILCRFFLQHAYFTGVRRMTVDLEGCRVEACLLSRAWDESRSCDYHEVKAVTYHQLKLERKDARWRAGIVLDI
jgi:SHS2 domain-containing protein